MKMAIPLIVAPMAMQAMCHQDGERAVARGALANAIPMGVRAFFCRGLLHVHSARLKMASCASRLASLQLHYCVCCVLQVSTMATTSIQDVAATGATLLFQVAVDGHAMVPSGIRADKIAERSCCRCMW